MTSQWARWRIKSPASRLFTQLFIQARIKENIKDPRHLPLWGEFTGDFPAQRASYAEMSPFDDAIMFSFISRNMLIPYFYFALLSRLK